MTARWFVKRRLAVAVRFAVQDGVLQTLEGPVHYAAGDALLAGAAGDQWPVARAELERTYEPVEPLLFGMEGAYQKKAIPVLARQAAAPETVELRDGQGRLSAQAGDWIVSDDRGGQWVVGGEIFANTYTALPGGDE